MNSNLDLSECEREPIHIPGSIQPHGALLALTEPDLVVVVASRNAARMLGVSEPVLGRRLGDFFDPASLKRLQAALKGDPEQSNPVELTLSDGDAAHGILHRTHQFLILEAEPAGTDAALFRTAYRSLISRFERLRLAEDLSHLYQIAAQEVASLTGYDRVMMYRFDERYNGQVIAETIQDEDLEPFLGLHYPASDIPEQARRLYVANPIRIIADSSYEPVPLEPSVAPDTGEPVDLSQSTLRSVSPIHCRYLRNMGVSSSMSLSLLDGARLWGLVACHHGSPKHVPYGTRVVLEFFARLVSSRIIQLERQDAVEKKNRAFAVQARLIDQMVSQSRFQDGLGEGSVRLTDLIECDGAAVLFRGEVTRIGSSLDESEIRRLGALVHAAAPGEVFHTDSLAMDMEGGADLQRDAGAGVIAVPISADGLDFLFWFRREWIHEVRWGGEPSKAVRGEAGQLTPRASFAAWVEEVRDCSRPWLDWEIEVAADFRTALVASVVHQAAELERLNASLLAASQQKDRFLATVSHELRNPLNAILGWVEVAARDPERKRLDQALRIIRANAQDQAALIEDLLDLGRIASGHFRIETKLLDITQVVAAAVETVRPNAESASVELSLDLAEPDSDIIGDPHRLRQVVWNLLTNAIKFSNPGGRIWVRLKRHGSELELLVRDEGVGIATGTLAQVFDPFIQGETKQRRAGLGLGLSIVKSIVELHNGRVSASSDGLGTGATFRVALPIAVLKRSEAHAVSSGCEQTVDLVGARILVVEDHDDAAQMVAALLQGHGAVVHTAGHGAEALEWLRRPSEVDLIVSDLDMPVMNGFEFLDKLRADAALAEIPTVALTAFSRSGDRAKAIKSGFRQHVPKPVDADELVAVVASLLDRLD